MTSQQKLRALYEDWTTRQPTNMEESVQLMALQTIGPKLLARLPEDPAELDALITAYAEQLLLLRSDPPELAEEATTA